MKINEASAFERVYYYDKKNNLMVTVVLKSKTLLPWTE